MYLTIFASNHRVSS